MSVLVVRFSATLSSDERGDVRKKLALASGDSTNSHNAVVSLSAFDELLLLLPLLVAAAVLSSSRVHTSVKKIS